MVTTLLPYLVIIGEGPLAPVLGGCAHNLEIRVDAVMVLLPPGALHHILYTAVSHPLLHSHGNIPAKVISKSLKQTLNFLKFFNDAGKTIICLTLRALLALSDVAQKLAGKVEFHKYTIIIISLLLPLVP